MESSGLLSWDSQFKTTAEKLELGKKLHSTTDQDIFIYRFDVEIGKWPRQLYKFEIGDYPGQDSEKFQITLIINFTTLLILNG